MLIQIGYDIEFDLPSGADALFALSVHPSRESALLKPECIRIDPFVPFITFTDVFGNNCGRAHLPQGRVRFTNDTIIEDSGRPDPVNLQARQWKVTDLPVETLQFLLASRYCEVDSELSDVAWNLFASVKEGWSRVEAICDFVHGHLKFEDPTSCSRHPFHAGPG